MVSDLFVPSPTIDTTAQPPPPQPADGGGRLHLHQRAERGGVRES